MWFQAHARCVWKLLCACNLPCQDASLMKMSLGTGQAWGEINADLWTGDPTFCFDIHTIQAHCFRSHLSNCSSPFVPNAAPATSQSKSNPTSNPITWDQIIPTKHTSNPIQSNALQVHTNQCKLKSEKNQNINTKLQKTVSKLKSQSQQIKGNQSKSNQSQPTPIRPNPLPNPITKIDINIKINIKIKAMESKPLLVQFLLVVNVCIQSLQNVLG